MLLNFAEDTPHLTVDQNKMFQLSVCGEEGAFDRSVQGSVEKLRVIQKSTQFLSFSLSFLLTSPRPAVAQVDNFDLGNLGLTQWRQAKKQLCSCSSPPLNWRSFDRFLYRKKSLQIRNSTAQSLIDSLNVCVLAVVYLESN